MTLTVEVMNKKTLNLLDAMETMGLIHVQPPVPQNPKKTTEDDKNSFRWMRGIHAGISKGTVEDFLADCRKDKEREFAIEKRQDEERARARLANAELSS